MNRLVSFSIAVSIALGCPLTAAGQSGLAPQPDAMTLSSSDLAIWNSPAFRRAFIDSYIAETEIEPRVTADEREQMQKVLDFIAANKMDEALRLLEKKGGPAASAVFDFTIANIHFQAERLDEAAAAYLAAVEKFPKFRRAWKNLALIHVRQNLHDKALPELTRVVELGGGDAITYGLLGFAYSNVENNLAAESAYRMAILLDPATMDWKMGLARAFFRQERFADAIALCSTMLADNPQRADLWLLQANGYIGMNQPLRAAENYEIVEGLGQSTSDSLNMLADIYVNEELFSLATTSYIRALDKDAVAKPDRAIRAAKVLTARGELAETRRLIDHIEKLNAETITPEVRKDLLKLRARIAVAEGAGEEEARVLEEIVTLDPLDGEALILLGQHSNRHGDAEKAVFYFERAASIEKFEADAKVRHAQLLVGQGKYDQALPLLRRAQLINPRDNIQQYLEQVERVAKSR